MQMKRKTKRRSPAAPYKKMARKLRLLLLEFEQTFLRKSEREKLRREISL